MGGVTYADLSVVRRWHLQHTHTLFLERGDTSRAVPALPLKVDWLQWVDITFPVDEKAVRGAAPARLQKCCERSTPVSRHSGRRRSLFPTAASSQGASPRLAAPTGSNRCRTDFHRYWVELPNQSQYIPNVSGIELTVLASQVQPTRPRRRGGADAHHPPAYRACPGAPGPAVGWPGSGGV